MHRTLAAIILAITALAAVTGCASPAPAAPGGAQENAVTYCEAPDIPTTDGGCEQGPSV